MKPIPDWIILSKQPFLLSTKGEALSPSDSSSSGASDRPPANEVQYRDLLDRARQAAQTAYVPYSEFPVGAAILAADGSVHAGSNVENASYGLTICAERSAVTAMVGAGQHEIVAIAVSAPKVPLTTPCGACRQVLNEFRPPHPHADTVVILDDRASGDALWLGDLLPRAFGPRNLEAATGSSVEG